MYDIKAIPTKYNGVQFRSRLEAKWAAFFDLCNWRWEYEPIDLEGWIPDFIIHGKRKIFVEVKPHYDFCKQTARKISNALYKSEYSQDEILYLGNSLMYDEWDDIYIGWLSEWDNSMLEKPKHHYDNAVIGAWDYPDKTSRLGFCHYQMSFTDRISGIYDGDHFHQNDEWAQTEAMANWLKAGNIVQWIKTSSRY